MKRLLIVSLLMTNMVTYPITEKCRQLSTGLVFAASAGIAAMSKDGAPLFGGFFVAGLAYGLMYKFTPTARLIQAFDLLEMNCHKHLLIDVQYKDNEQGKQDFFTVLDQKYCQNDLPLIGAKNDIENRFKHINHAGELIAKAEVDIDPKNDIKLHNIRVDIGKQHALAHKNATDALVRIKNHLKYEKQLKLSKNLNTTERQTAAKEKIADAQIINANAQTKTANAKESSVFLEWLKWIISFLSKK
ncbi:MAG TPA: hypothetical protein VKU36_00510 [Candidatus Babeliales bacterium]|jgi:hypothetical protein|nr:hypothetical protein [Candidatus Babeliales bacterium]